MLVRINVVIDSTLLERFRVKIKRQQRSRWMRDAIDQCLPTISKNGKQVKFRKNQKSDLLPAAFMIDEKQQKRVDAVCADIGRSRSTVIESLIQQGLKDKLQ